MPLFAREPIPETRQAWSVMTGMMRSDGSEIIFYQSKPKGAKAPVFQDGGIFVRSAQSLGLELKVMVFQQLAHSFGVKIDESLSLFEDSTGDLQERELRFVQCLAALDGVLRMWRCSAPPRIPPMAVEDHSLAGKETL